MGTLVHISNPFEPLKADVYRLDRPVTVRRLVQKHKGLRRHTAVFVPCDRRFSPPIYSKVYGRRKVREFRRLTVCRFNDRDLTRAEWKRTTVGPNDVVIFYTPLQGGGGGFLKIIGIVLAIGIAIAAPYLGPLAASAVLGYTVAAGSTAAIIGTAVVGIGLSALSFGVMSLFAQPAPTDAGAGFAGGTPATSPTYNLTSQGNYARLGSAIPEPFGKNRMFPDFVTTPYARYTEVDPDETPGSVVESLDQFIHEIVGLGIGEYEVDEDTLKLGDTPFSSYEDIEWAIIEPGALPDLDIADERWITATDLADIELLDAAEGSPWAGPYAANPAGTTIDTIEVDIAAPRGLWAFNEVTYLAAREVTFEIEAQEIDDTGTPVGDPDTWDSLSDPLTVNRKSQAPQRLTVAELALPSAGRWQVRMRRTDTKETGVQSGHQLDWIGLRGRVIGRRTFQNMTCISLKMKAGAGLSAAQSRQFNVEAVRKLETWEGSAMGTTKAATRNPCDAFAYIARTTNGGRLRDDQIDLAGLYANYDDFASNIWHFNFVFDGTITVSEALARVARSVVAERVTQGGKLHLVRDVEVEAPVAMFSPRNIAQGSFSKQYVMVDSTSPDALIGTYIDQVTWKPIDVTVAFDDSAQERPTRLTLHGVANRDQARAVLWNLARADRYRRAVYGWSTAMEGLAVTFGDGISFSHDVPNYGQTLEVIDFDDSDPLAPVFTFVDQPVIVPPDAHYAAVRDSLGHKAGPFRAHRVEDEPFKLWLVLDDPGDLPEILIGGDKERTWLQLGKGEAYSRPLKVKMVTPRDSMSADIVAFDDDPRMYEALPDEPEVPIGVPTDPMTVPITDGDGPVVNLRTLANDAGYSGLAVQEVTFTLASDVEVIIVRGSWPVGAVPILELEGTLTGTDGAAGAAGIGGTPAPAFSDPGDGLSGGAGGSGGTALNASSGALVVTGAGTIRGGKGGGGGGGGGGGASYEEIVDDLTIGHLVAGGNGGAGNGGTGSTGTTEGPVTTGNGGNGGAAAGSYGATGSAGASGTAASGGIFNGAGGAGGAGGVGGKAIVGVANVDLTGFTGLIIGTTS